MNSNRVKLVVVALTLSVAAVGHAWDEDTLAFYPFTDATAGSSAVGSDTIRNAIDADTYKASGTAKDGTVTFDADAPGKYLFDDISTTSPTPVATDVASVFIHGDTDLTGGYVSFAGLAGAFAKQLAENGEGTIEFFWKIPEGEVQKKWSKMMMLYGDYTVSSADYKYLFFNLPYDTSGSYAGSYAFCYPLSGSWVGSTLSGQPHHNATWHHVAVVYAGGKFQMTLDYTHVGSSFSATVTDPTDPTTLPFEIGCGETHSVSGNHGWHGKMAGLRFTKKALTADRFLRASDSPHYYSNLPEQTVDMGPHTLAFYPFAKGTAGASTKETRFFNYQNVETHFGTTTIPANGQVVFDDDAPGKYIFTNFAYGATAAFTDPKSIKFVNDDDDYRVEGAKTNFLNRSGTVSFADIATVVSSNAEGTVEFFWKIPERYAQPSWKPTVMCDTDPVGCKGDYEVFLPLDLSNASKTSVWLSDYGEFQTGYYQRITFDYPKASDIPDNRWHHFAITYSNGVYRMFCDYMKGTGQQDTPGEPYLPHTPQTTSKPLKIGGDYFHGKISCVRVSDRALPVSEMLHASSIPTCKPPEELYLRFEDLEDGVELDYATGKAANTASNYDTVNPGIYPGTAVKDAVVYWGNCVHNPKGTSTVWKRQVRTSSDAAWSANARSSYFEADPRNPENPTYPFTCGRGFRYGSDVSVMIDGSLTAELFAKLDFPSVKAHIYDIKSDAPNRVSLVNHAIAGENTGAWNLYLDQLFNWPIVHLNVTLADGTVKGYQSALCAASTNGWHHYAVTYDAENLKLKLYFDGQAIIDETLAQKLKTHVGCGYFIGCGGNNNPFDGWIDEVRLTRGILPPSKFLGAGNNYPSSLILK